MSSSVIFITTGAATYVLLYPVRLLLRKAEIVDRPNSRSSHAIPTIRGGGVTLIITIVGYVVASGWKLDPFRIGIVTAGFTLLAVVSFIDDVRTLRASVRFGVQTITALAALIAILSEGFVFDLTTMIFMAISFVWIVGYTNAFNFMDGINGIAGMQAVWTGFGTAAVGVALGIPSTHATVMFSLVVAGAALGFLPHNFPRARVFMGDVSSAAIGFLLAAIAVWIARLTSWWVLFWVGLLHTNFVLDTGITLVRRARRGDRLHDAHREHFYQRLVRAGYSHVFVTLTETCVQIIVAFAIWWATPAGLYMRLAVGIGVVSVWLCFFAFAEVKFRAAEAARLVRAGGGQVSA